MDAEPTKVDVCVARVACVVFFACLVCVARVGCVRCRAGDGASFDNRIDAPRVNAMPS